MERLSLEEFAEYTNLTDEEKRIGLIMDSNHVVERNNGEPCTIAKNSDYKVFINI